MAEGRSNCCKVFCLGSQYYLVCIKSILCHFLTYFMLRLNANKFLSKHWIHPHPLILFTSLENSSLFWSLYLKYIWSFPLTKGNLYRVDSNVALLHYSWLSPSKNDSVRLDLEEGRPPTKMTWSQVPEKFSPLLFWSISSVWHNLIGWDVYQDWLDEDGSCYSLAWVDPICNRQKRLRKRFLLRFFLAWDPTNLSLAQEMVNFNLVQLLFQPIRPCYNMVSLFIPRYKL